VVVDRTQVSSRLCYGGSLYPTWSDLDNLRDTYGWSFDSDGMTHNDMTTMTATQQYEESCGSLAYLAEEGMTTADALYAYGDDESTTAIQANIVSTCYDYGRTYTGGVNSEATLSAPWFQNTNSVTGGACNDPTLPCYKLNVGGKRYPSPAWISSLIQVTANEWAVIQFYRMVSGASLGTTPSWDCTSPNWQDHWTSETEMYCINDFDQVLSSIPADAVVTSPATVAAAWGRHVSNIAGRVTAQNTGNPVAGAIVTWSGGTASTDSNGYYTLANVTPGIDAVAVSAPGEPSANAKVQVTAGGTAVQNFSLGATPGEISGTVRDDNGNPIPATTVTCTCTGGSTASDGSGDYSLTDVVPGTYSMTFAAQGFAIGRISDVVVTAAGDTVEDVVLVPGGTISGQVTDLTAPGNPPIVGASVTCTCQNESVPTDANGEYGFDDLAGGDYSVTFAAPAYVSQIVSGVIVTPGSTTTLDGSLIEDGWIGGTVTSATTGAPIVGATVACTCQIVSTATDDTGTYSFTNVSPGIDTVTVSAPGFTTASNSDVSVAPGAGAVAGFSLVPSAHQPVFSDGFESGNLAAWTASKGLVVEATLVHSGSFAAAGDTTRGATFARRKLPATFTTGYARAWFDVVSQKSRISVLGLNSASGAEIADIYVTPEGQLGVIVGKSAVTSSMPVGLGVFHELELAVTVDGTSSTTRVWLDGSLVSALSVTGSMGSSPIEWLQLGQVTGRGTYDMVFDDVAFDTAYLP